MVCELCGKEFSPDKGERGCLHYDEKSEAQIMLCWDCFTIIDEE